MGGLDPAVLSPLVRVVGVDHVHTDPHAIASRLRDNSWLSPLLRAHLGQRRASEGATLGVAAVVEPATDDEVLEIVALAVESGLAITPRGAGTSNLGQATPSEGGIVLDVRRLHGVTSATAGRITARAGTRQGDVDAAARREGRELTLLTTTYATATIGGWVAGGHVGLGAPMYGTTWDGNVLGARVATAEPVPRILTLDEHDVTPLVHTFGTCGILLDVTVPHVPARPWADWVVTFAGFDDACRFTEDLAHSDVRHRVAAAQPSTVMPAFRALTAAGVPSDQPAVLVIADRDQHNDLHAVVKTHGGAALAWRHDGSERPPLASMVFGHRMLWVKRLLPNAAFLNVYFDPEHVHEQIRLLDARFGDRLVPELKFQRSSWLRRLRGLPPAGTLPAGLLALPDGTSRLLDDVIACCEEIGVSCQNPHTSVLEDTGLFPDISSIHAFKRLVDPTGVLNPGKTAVPA
jgi:FAD/FMN-containing dehydrogenase